MARINTEVDEKDPTIGDICLLFVPGATYKALSDAASKRQISVALLLQRAIDDYLVKTEKDGQTTTKLLVEEKK